MGDTSAPSLIYAQGERRTRRAQPLETLHDLPRLFAVHAERQRPCARAPACACMRARAQSGLSESEGTLSCSCCMRFSRRCRCRSADAAAPLRRCHHRRLCAPRRPAAPLRPAAGDGASRPAASKSSAPTTRA